MVFLGLIAVLGVTIYLYWHTMPQISASRRYLLAGLRFIALAIVVILLLNPVLRYSKKIAQKPRQILLLDNSLSMEEKSKAGSKYEIFREEAQQTRDLLTAKGYDAVILEFADGLEGSRQSSRLAKSLSESGEAAENLSDILLFSDGWFDDSDPDFIQNIQYPLHVYSSNFAATGFDLEISSLKYNQRAWLKELNPFIVDVSAQNYSAKAKLDFYVEDEKVHTEEVDFTGASYQQLLIEHEFKQTGLQKIKFVIQPDSLNELQSENNEYPGAVLVLEDKARLLVISDKFSWEGRFLVQAAQKNQRFDTRYLHKDARLHHQREVVQLGTQMENCKVLCLINYGALSFNNTQTRLIERFLDNGGGLLVMGKPIGGLESILPVSSSGISRQFKGQFRLLTASEPYQTFQIMREQLDEIPPVRFFYANSRLSGAILAEFPAEQNPPAIVYQDQGNGKILYFGFLDLWKWQLWGEDGHYYQFINNVFQWLSYPRSQSFYAWSDQNSYLLGEEVTINLAAFDEKFAPLPDLKAEIIVNKAGQEFRRDYLTRKNDIYQYSFISSEAGNYEFSIKDESRAQKTSGSFIINPANSEVRDRGINSVLLNYLATQTGGRIFDSANDFQDYPQPEISYGERQYEIPIYKKWYTITLFLFAFCLEIFFRKRWGLL